MRWWSVGRLAPARPLVALLAAGGRGRVCDLGILAATLEERRVATRALPGPTT